MAKDKEFEKQYKLEGQRRMTIRKQRRNEKYFKLVREAQECGKPIWAIKAGYWPDSNSPTGYSQKCDWRGNCQYPCNGDC